jgi:hypothetical protein
MPQFQVQLTALSFLGTISLAIGVYLIMSGLDIAHVPVLEVTPGLRSWVFGTILAVVGIVLLIPTVLNEIPPPAPTPGPTPVLPTLLPTPKPIPPATAEQALEEYYYLLIEREYDVTWSKLTDHFKNDRELTFEGYKDFWDGVGQVDVVSIESDENTGTCAWLTAVLIFSYESGATFRDRMNFNLVWDSVSQQWMITYTETLESVRVSSQG